jgi:hypothetical protein
MCAKRSCFVDRERPGLITCDKILYFDKFMRRTDGENNIRRQYDCAEAHAVLFEAALVVGVDLVAVALGACQETKGEPTVCAVFGPFSFFCPEPASDGLRIAAVR